MVWALECSKLQCCGKTLGGDLMRHDKTHIKHVSAESPPVDQTDSTKTLKAEASCHHVEEKNKNTHVYSRVCVCNKQLCNAAVEEHCSDWLLWEQCGQS